MAILRKEDLNDTTWKIISVTHIGDRPNGDRLENNYEAKFCTNGLYCEKQGSFGDKLLNNGLWTIDEENNKVTIQNKKAKFFKRGFTIMAYDQDLQEMTTQVTHDILPCGLYATYDVIIWKKVV